MNIRRRRASGATWTVLCLALVAAAPSAPPGGGGGEKAPAQAALDQPAPDFTLVDTRSQVHRLSEYRGKIVVLEWTDPGCLFVQRQYRSRAMPATQKKARQLDEALVWLAIDSTANATAEKDEFWVRQHKLPYPVLLDPTGATARAFDARMTPQMFLIDRKGILRYQGAIDDNRIGHGRQDEVTHYLLAALKQLVDKAKVTPNHVKPYGCAIKFRP